MTTKPAAEPNRKPWGFCETPNSTCTMNYCDDNGCQERKRNLTSMENNIQQIASKFNQEHGRAMSYAESVDFIADLGGEIVELYAESVKQFERTKLEKQISELKANQCKHPGNGICVDITCKSERTKVIDFVHEEQRTCLDDAEYKALERVLEFIKSHPLDTNEK